MFHDYNGDHQFQLHIPPAAADAATADVAVFVAPYAMKVSALNVVSNAAVSGTDTDSRNLNVQKVVGADEAEVAHIDLELGTDLIVGRNPLSVTAFTLAAGDRLVVESELVGTNGLALPVLTLEIIAQGA
jgi:hypothetical protein